MIDGADPGVPVSRPCLQSVWIYEPDPVRCSRRPASDREVNKRLNADVQFNIITQGDYGTKLATMMAGNDLADFILIPRGIPNVTAKFLEAKAADLTPYLAGDLARDYPFLASIPTYAWKNSGSVRNGKLYMVPIERYYTGYFLIKNSAVYDSEISGYTRRTRMTSNASCSS